MATISFRSGWFMGAEMGAHHGSDSEFPAGLRVLVVDDDRICLLILDRLLRECLYRVTTCERAADALKLLRDNRDGFDVVISDVHMPDMDGYKLLELVGLEMDLPVLMMSSNSETSAVMKGIKQGACDYLLKPVRIEELKNIWQHVIRRKHKELEGGEHHKPDDAADPLANDCADIGAGKASKKRKDNFEEDDDPEPENEDPATSKKPRVVWSEDLHQKFVNAVEMLGIEKAVPKRILELMDVKGLTRENVASHLQKYRLYLKRRSGLPYPGCGGMGSTFFECTDERFWPSAAGLMTDYRSQLPARSLISSLQSGLFERVIPNMVDPIFLGQLATIQGIGTGLIAKPPFAVPLLNSASDLNHLASNGIDMKVMGIGTGGQGHNDKLCNSPLSSHNEPYLTQERNTLMERKKSSSLVQILQQQRIGAQMALCDSERNNMHHVEPCSSLINENLNCLNSSCKPGPEMGTIPSLSYEPSTMLGPFRRKFMEVKSHSNVPDAGLSHYSSLSSLVPQPLPVAVELSSKYKLSGLQAVLSDQVGGNNPFHFRKELLMNCKGWNLEDSNHNQGSTPRHASQLSCVQEPSMDCIINAQYESAEAINVKPLATSMMPILEQDFGVREVLKAASLESLVASKMGSIIPEPFPTADDLLTTYIKQQQHDIESGAEGNAEDSYTLGNVYVK